MLKTNSILSNKSPETPKIYKYYRGDNNINNLEKPQRTTLLHGWTLSASAIHNTDNPTQ